MKTVAQQLEEKGIQIGMQKGLAKGIQEGIMKKTIEIAENLLKYGDSIDKVVAITGLEKATVVNLKKNLK